MAATPSGRPRQLIGLAEAAASYTVGYRTLRRWISDGRLPAYRVGPRLLKVDVADLEALARRVPTADGPA